LVVGLIGYSLGINSLHFVLPGYQEVCFSFSPFSSSFQQLTLPLFHSRKCVRSLCYAINKDRWHCSLTRPHPPCLSLPPPTPTPFVDIASVIITLNARTSVGADGSSSYPSQSNDRSKGFGARSGRNNTNLQSNSIHVQVEHDVQITTDTQSHVELIAQSPYSPYSANSVQFSNEDKGSLSEKGGIRGYWAFLCLSAVMLKHLDVEQSIVFGLTVERLEKSARAGRQGVERWKGKGKEKRKEVLCDLNKVSEHSTRSGKSALSSFRSVRCPEASSLFRMRR
jgi:hypothetical protein